MVPTKGQWWSNRSTQRLATRQCFDLRGLTIRHVWHNGTLLSSDGKSELNDSGREG